MKLGSVPRDSHQRRALIAGSATVATIAAVLATLWWSRDEVHAAGVVAVLSVAAVAGWSVQLPRLAAAWDRVGYLVSTLLIVALVSVTGGAASNYQDMFLIVPLVSALTLGAPAFTASVVVAVLGAFAPLVYDQPGQDFLGDTLADAAVWIGAATVVFVQVQRRRQQEARLREADELKSAFLQATSHELRTPLTVIQGIAETLVHRDRLSEVQQQELTGRLLRHSERLQRLLTDLLDVDRLLRGAVNLDLRPADLSRIVLEIVDQLGSERVHVDVEPVVAVVDARKIERVIENLLANAVRHAGDDADIWMRLRLEGPSVVLTVEDNGPGVPEELRTEIFEPFRQGPDSARSATPGTGIGLALVQRFVALHNGTVWTEPRPGGGARFRVSLPRDPKRDDRNPPTTPPRTAS